MRVMAILISTSGHVPHTYESLAPAAVVAGVATTHVYAGVELPARRLIIGTIGAAGVTLTRPDGVQVVLSAAQCNAFNGVITRQFIATQSANSTDLSVDY